MDTKQWNTLLKESIAACDMADIIRQTDNWFQQGVDYWKSWGGIASTYAVPQTWLETAGGISKTVESYMKDMTRLYGLGPDTSLDEAIEEQKRLAGKSQAALAIIKKEKSTLKRTLTQKENALKDQRSEMVKHQKRLGEQEKEIEALQTKVKAQAERLILLEAAGKNKPQAPARTKPGAVVPPAGK